MYAFVRRLATLDRRIVYVTIVAVLSLPFIWTYSLPIYPETYTQQMYDEIERIASDPIEREKVILVLHNWGPGTSGENEPQFITLMRHLLRPREDGHKLKFVLLCSIWDPVFHDTALVSFEKAKQLEIERARRLGLPTPSWTYGEDYLDFGFKNAPVFAPFARSVLVTPREFYGTDYVNKRDLMDDSSYPLLERYQSIEDVSAIIIVTGGDETRDVAGLVKGDYPHVSVLPAVLGIVATDLYPYVKSGQLSGLMNSARGASEYRSLLDPEAPTTTNVDNAMSAGKTLLLILIVLGNLAFVITRRAERRGLLPPTGPAARQPLPPLPKGFMWGLFIAFAMVYVGSATYGYLRFQETSSIPIERVGKADDDPALAYPNYERVGPDDVAARIDNTINPERDPVAAEFADDLATARWNKLIERRIGEFLMVFCTLGVFAFLLGDNRFYRFVEAIIVGGAMAYMLGVVEEIIWPDLLLPAVAAAQGTVHPANVLWLLLLIPSSLWYFTYSKKYRWLNQLIVALFLGFAFGPEFKKQINLLIPQILDSIQPIWPWTPYAGGVIDVTSRVEHLVFLIVLVLSLSYFIFFFRPRTRAGHGVLTAGRLAMMVGFGASFGNTVNTRLSWLAPRIGFLWEDWLEKLFT